jgi:hypothetical protein
MECLPNKDSHTNGGAYAPSYYRFRVGPSVLRIRRQAVHWRLNDRYHRGSLKLAARCRGRHNRVPNIRRRKILEPCHPLAGKGEES